MYFDWLVYTWLPFYKVKTDFDYARDLSFNAECSNFKAFNSVLTLFNLSCYLCLIKFNSLLTNLLWWVNYFTLSSIVL